MAEERIDMERQLKEMELEGESLDGLTSGLLDVAGSGKDGKESGNTTP